MAQYTNNPFSLLMLLGQTPLSQPSPPPPPSQPPKKRLPVQPFKKVPPERKSKFLNVHKDISRLRKKSIKGKKMTLQQILDALHKKYPDMNLPRSKSPLSRFIEKCQSGGCGNA